MSNVKSCAGSHFTFRDGAKGTVVGIRQLNVTGLAKLDNVLLVDDLTANLISISQLCDQDMTVNFSKDGCSIVSKDESVMVKGIRSTDNYYSWNAPSIGHSTSCLLSRKDSQNYCIEDLVI